MQRAGLEVRDRGLGAHPGIARPVVPSWAPLLLVRALRQPERLRLGDRLPRLSSGLVAELYGPGELEGFDGAREALARLEGGEAPDRLREPEKVLG